MNHKIYEHITGSIASFPPRIEALKEVIKSVLPQVHTLNIYLNEYTHVPEFLIQKENVNVFLGFEHSGDLKDNGKFYVADTLKTGYHFTFDDDIIYPTDYVQKMISAIEKFNRTCIIGVHGSNYKENAQSYIKNREVYHFKKESGFVFVDMLGTGTTAYHTDSFKISLADLKTKGSVDLWFAVKAKQMGLGMLTIKRPDDWLQVIPLETENLYEHARQNDGYLFSLIKENLFPLLEKRNYVDYCNFNKKYSHFSEVQPKNQSYRWKSEEIKDSYLTFFLNKIKNACNLQKKVKNL